MILNFVGKRESSMDFELNFTLNKNNEYPKTSVSFDLIFQWVFIEAPPDRNVTRHPCLSKTGWTMGISTQHPGDKIT